MRFVRRSAKTAITLGLSVAFCHLAFATEPNKQATQSNPPTAAEPALPDDIPGLLEYVKGYHGLVVTPLEPGDKEAARKLVEQRDERRRSTGKTSRNIEAALEKIRATATEADRLLPEYQEAMDLRMIFRTILFSEGPRRGTDRQRAELIEEIKTRLASNNPPIGAVVAARKVGGALESGDDPAAAIEFNRHVGQILAKSSDPLTAQAGHHMLGAVRRLELIGTPLLLEGTHLDGSKFDWASYRGRTVLVEIWATWCAACLREFPNVERNRREYRDRGFEVVGINLDVERHALDKYLADHPLAWPTLHDGGPEASPFARKYGINAGSMAILVDRAGNVVSLSARGAELDRWLAKLLGPPNADAPAN